MRTTPLSSEDLRGVFAVPPLARSDDRRRTIDLEQNNLIVRHIVNGGITRLIYGGNAFLYHVTLDEYEQLLEWLNGFSADLLVIPSAGPSFGRAMDQASLLRKYQFPFVMMLPCGDPRDAAGLERGYREFAEAANTKLLVYLKDEDNFGREPREGLDAVARLVDDGICAGIKYAVVRHDPSQDSYLDALLERVDPSFVISGIGERPAVTHVRDWRLPGFTTGSGCIAPRLSQLLFDACARGEFAEAERLKTGFLAHEDLRDRWGPARVVHSAIQLAGIARTGPLPPYVSVLSDTEDAELASVACALAELNSSAMSS